MILNALTSIRSDDKDFNDEFIFFSRSAVQEKIGLSPGGLLLFSLLSGGDYNRGLEGCGAITALGLARCGFGDTLLEALTNHKRYGWSDTAWNSFLIEWRAGIQHELANNSSGKLHSRQAKLALVFPETFPASNIIQFYSAPLVSNSFPNSDTWYELCEPMIFNIARFCLDKFHWTAEKAKKKFTASLWDGVFLWLLYFVGLCICFIVRVSNYDIKPEPVLRCDPARNLVSTPFIQARILRIQRKLRKGKFSDAENKKQLRLTVSTSNFVLLMGYADVVGTEADEVKVWVPRNILPAAILKSSTLVSRVVGTSKGNISEGGDGEEMVMSKRAGYERAKNRSTMGPHDVIEISSSSDEQLNDTSTKGWLGFLDLTTPEPEQAQSSGTSEVVWT